MGEEAVDHVKLETYLRALAYATRLELLALLRSPRTLNEIRLQPQQTKPGENPERPMSRQALQDHLERLMEAGVVTMTRAKQEDSARIVNEYTANQQRLFAILEELRRVFSVPGYVVVASEDTAPLAEPRRAAKLSGPCLVLVHGLHEGRTYALGAERSVPSSWILGRRPDADIPLSYDPFVSSENTRILRMEHGFEIEDIPGNRNGTLHNWRRLQPGERARLASGDVIGAGRSLLVFRGEESLASRRQG